MKNKVYVIGLDGGTFDLLRPWIEAGRLPRLETLIRRGVSGELESTVPPVTGPAWTSFITGKNPAKHGVFDFKLQDRRTYGYHVIDPQSRRGASIWDLVGRHGGRVAVLNLPITYPPEKVSGVMVSGFLTPSGRRDYVHPPGMLEEIEDRFGPYALYPPLPFFALTESDADIDQFLEGITHQLDYQFQVAKYLAAKIDPDFLMLHIHGGDLIGHWLWHLVDDTNPHYSKAVADKYEPRIYEYFRRFDKAVGEFLDEAGHDVNVLVLSDHGNGSIHTAIDLNNWLLNEGYLKLKDRSSTKLKYEVWRMGVSLEALFRNRWLRTRLGRVVKRFLKNGGESPLDSMRKGAGRIARIRLTTHDIDWSRTRVFSMANTLGQIMINVKGVWAQGCVAPGHEYESLCDEVGQKLAQLRDPNTGQPVAGDVYLKHDVYSGAYFDDAPDITYVPLRSGYLAGGYRFISNKVFFPVAGMTGFHRMNGILLGAGPALQSGTAITGARIIDLCPTLLYLMGLPIPKDIDGRVLEDIVAESFLSQNSIDFTEETAGEATERAPLTAEEEAEIIGRLQGLGYL